MLPAWYLRGTYFSDKWHNCHEKFAPKKAKKNIQNKSGNAAKMPRKKTFAALPRKSGNAANAFAAIQKRQCSENMPRLKTQKSGSGTLA